MNITRYIVMKLLKLTEGVYNTCDSYIPLNFIIYEKKGMKLNKFQSMDIMILKNPFHSKEEKDQFLTLFCDAQKIRRRLCKFVRYWRWKKAILYSSTEDLIGTPLSELKEHLKITLLQKNTKYTFRISDLLNIWMKSLTYTSAMTPQPKFPRNPYIGLDFQIHHLYQIYFHIRFYTNFNIPIYLLNFFKCDFNVQLFRESMYTLLREDAIKSHLSDSTVSVLYFDIVNMINGNQKIFKNRKMKKNINFSGRIKIVKLLKPILYFYLFGILSCNPFVKRKMWRRFISSVKRFLCKHPAFGRLIKRKRCFRISTDLNYLANTNRINISVDSSDSSDNSDNSDSSSDSNAENQYMRSAELLSIV